MKRTPGGLFGYCSSNVMTRRNVPSSKGVSDGPMMTAFLFQYQNHDAGCEGLEVSCDLPCHDVVGHG